jgi:hypothetical protein
VGVHVRGYRSRHSAAFGLVAQMERTLMATKTRNGQARSANGSSAILRIIRGHAGPAIAAVAAAAVSIFLFYRPAPLLFDGGHINPQTIVAGGEGTITWDVQWSKTDCDAVINSVIVMPGGGIFEVDRRAISGPQQGTYLSREIHIPRTFPAGTYAYRARYDISCNLPQQIAPIKITSPEISFQVVAQ